MLVDSGASVHDIDSDLLPNIQRPVRDFRELQPRMIITNDLSNLNGTATEVSPVRVVGTSDFILEINVSVTLVPGLGRHLWSPGAAQARGLHTVFSDRN